MLILREFTRVYRTCKLMCSLYVLMYNDFHAVVGYVHCRSVNSPKIKHTNLVKGSVTYYETQQK